MQLLTANNEITAYANAASTSTLTVLGALVVVVGRGKADGFNQVVRCAKEFAGSGSQCQWQAGPQLEAAGDIHFFCLFAAACCQ